MKKLTNVSPFILLLVPVFVMIMLTFAVPNEKTNDRITAKPTIAIPNLKVPVSFLK